MVPAHNDWIVLGVEMMVVMIVVIKLFWFGDNTIICVENAVEFVKTLLQLISEFKNVTGYKINIQKSIIYILTTDIEVKIIMSLHSMKNMKHLGINLTKDLQDLYSRTVKHCLEK